MEKEGQTNIMNLATDGLEITKLSTAGSKEDPNKIMISTKLTPEERSDEGVNQLKSFNLVRVRSSG